MKNTNLNGYIALVSVLILSAVILSILVTVSITSAYRINGILHEQSVNNIKLVVESCAEEVLLKLNHDNLLPGTVTMDGVTCNVIQNSQVGTLWDFDVSAALSEMVYTINIVADRTDKIYIISWRNK
ncbi:MAG: hypothetical protein QG570_43 [Patescibacteria group bacterium]|nr:hypothetical protein [Patescibacteria group bacterium]